MAWFCQSEPCGKTAGKLVSVCLSRRIDPWSLEASRWAGLDGSAVARGTPGVPPERGTSTSGSLRCSASSHVPPRKGWHAVSVGNGRETPGGSSI